MKWWQGLNSSRTRRGWRNSRNLHQHLWGVRKTQPRMMTNFLFVDWEYSDTYMSWRKEKGCVFFTPLSMVTDAWGNSPRGGIMPQRPPSLVVLIWSKGPEVAQHITMDRHGWIKPLTSWWKQGEQGNGEKLRASFPQRHAIQALLLLIRSTSEVSLIS